MKSSHHIICCCLLLLLNLSIASQQNASAQDYASVNNSYSNPVVTTSILTDKLETNYQYNTSPHQQSNMATAYDPAVGHWWQYIVYWDETRQAHISRRNFSSHGAWQTPVNIHAAIGGAALEQDSHNTIAVGIDPRGYIHVSGNHHVDPLRYAISLQPHNISAFTQRRSMIASNASSQEHRVTYPTFFNSTDGDLFFYYRNQTVGGGKPTYSSYLNKWNPDAGASGSWERVAEIAYGLKLRFYNQRIAVDHNRNGSYGRFHIMAMWRNDANSGNGVTNNEDIFHLYSDDKGKTWRQYGKANKLSLPIGMGDIDLIVDTKPHPNSRFLSNQSGLEIDAQGRPHALILMSTSAGSNNRALHHIWHDGSRWNVKALSKYKRVTRPSIITTPSSEVFAFITVESGPSGQPEFVLVNITPGSNQYDNEVITLTRNLTTGGAATNYDANAFYEHGKLSFLAARSAISPESFNTNWQQDGTVVTIDLNQLDTLRAAPYLAPATESVFTDNASVSARVSATQQTIYQTAQLSNDPQRRQHYVKLTVNGQTTGSGTDGSVNISYNTSAGIRSVGRLRFNSTSGVSRSTPWLPLSDLATGTVKVTARTTSGSGSLQVNNLSIIIHRATVAPFPLTNSPPLTTPTLPIVTPASEPAVSSCIDDDGDGWGWNGVESCQTGNITPANTTETPPTVDAACIDDDGDGWGWNGVESCRPDMQPDMQPVRQPDTSTPPDSNNPSAAQACIDDDGDGWGWNGVESCRPDASTSPNNASPAQSPSCVDEDGDGWGWNGSASCRI